MHSTLLGPEVRWLRREGQGLQRVENIAGSSCAASAEGAVFGGGELPANFEAAALSPGSRQIEDAPAAAAGVQDEILSKSSEVLKALEDCPPLLKLPAKTAQECDATDSSEARAHADINETLQVRIARLWSAVEASDGDSDDDFEDVGESQQRQRIPRQAPNDSDTSPSKYMRLPPRRAADSTEVSAHLEPLLQNLLERSGGCFSRGEIAALLTDADAEDDIALFEDILQSFDNLADDLAHEDDLQGEGDCDGAAVEPSATSDRASSTPACSTKPRRPSQAVGRRRSHLNETRWVEAGARESGLTTELLTTDKYATMRGLLAADMVSLARYKNSAVRADDGPVLPLPPSSCVDRHNKRKIRRDERRQVSNSRLGFRRTGLSVSTPIAALLLIALRTLSMYSSVSSKPRLALFLLHRMS